MALGRLVEGARPIRSVEGVRVSANADIFSSDLKAPDNGFWIIQVDADTAGYPLVKRTVNGVALSPKALNEASDLTANALYEFWVAAKKDDAINVQFSASATVTVRVFFVRSS
ncbi:MAG TPA: hypothetical protein ENF26_04535 [Methanomicrobia archaeon]|nr:hypothetical protein [Methanomicrobia archaeon]HEX59397.1 hypothetical protein [Methanomicrobia archaeon]